MSCGIANPEQSPCAHGPGGASEPVLKAAPDAPAIDDGYPDEP